GMPPKPTRDTRSPVLPNVTYSIVVLSSPCMPDMVPEEFRQLALETRGRGLNRSLSRLLSTADRRALPPPWAPPPRGRAWRWTRWSCEYASRGLQWCCPEPTSHRSTPPAPGPGPPEWPSSPVR